MKPTLRVVQKADIDTVLVLMHELSVQDRLPDQRPLDFVRARSALEELVSNPSYGRTWLIYDGDMVVGYLVLTFGYSLEFHGRDAFIDELFIRASHRGRGWGTRAMEQAESTSKALNIRAVHLEVGHGNTRAQEFYSKMGYTNHERHLMTKWI